MELLLFAVIFLQFGYLVYQDIQNRRERERLQLKIMAKDLGEYKSALEEAPEPAPSVDSDPYLSLEEAGIDRVVKAKEV